MSRETGRSPLKGAVDEGVCRAARLVVPGWMTGLMLMGLLLMSTSCATGSAKKAKASESMTEQVRPGAGAWSEHALMLPKQSPIVVVAQLDDLLASLDEAWDWIIAEPAMLGDSGTSIVGFLQSERASLVGAEGLDPLTPEAWVELGIDVTRKLYIGAYPVTDKDSRAVLDTVDRVIREEVGLDEDEPVETALTAAAVLSGDEPLRIYSQISQQLDGLDPMTGFRLVVPLTDAETFLTSLGRFLDDLELERVEPTEVIAGQADQARVYVSKDSAFEALLVRVRGDTATVDLLYEVMGARSVGMGDGVSEDETLDRLERMVDEFPYGRPGAPRPAGGPAAGIAIDQAGAADIALMRGVRQALREARGAGLEERDARFTYNLFRAFESADNWTVASKHLTGLSYGLFVGEPGRLFRLGIDLYGSGRDEPLPVSDPAVGISAAERSMAASIDLAPMVDEAWQEWIGVERPLSALDSFDTVDFDTTLFALSLPRSLAILFTNAEKVFEDRLPGWAEPLYEQRSLLSRLDVATAGVDIRGMRLTPKVVGVVTMKPGLDDEQTASLGESMAAALANLAGRVDAVQDAPADDADEAPEAGGDDPELGEALPMTGGGDDVPEAPTLEPEPLEPGKISALEVDGMAATEVHYFWNAGADEPYLFFSYGLGADDAGREHARIREGEAQRAEKILLFRSEPVALFSLMTFYQPDLFEPVDVGILAQRIGALSFEVTPQLDQGVQRIRYDFVVGAPPNLGTQ